MQQIQDTAARLCEPLWSWGLVPGQRSWNLILCQHWGTLQQGTERICYIIFVISGPPRPTKHPSIFDPRLLGRYMVKVVWQFPWKIFEVATPGKRSLLQAWRKLKKTPKQLDLFMGGTMEHFNIWQDDRTINGSKWFNHSTCTS